MRRQALVSLAGISLFATDVADAKPPVRSAPYDWRAAAKALDQSYDACLALDQRVSFTAEWEARGRLVSVTTEEPANDPKLEKCLLGVLRSVSFPTFVSPLTAKMSKIAERTDCVVISVRSDKPIPIFVDGVLVGRTPVDYRTRKGDYLVTWTTTNGFTFSERVKRSEWCGKTSFAARSWIDPAQMVPGLGAGP